MSVLVRDAAGVMTPEERAMEPEAALEQDLAFPRSLGNRSLPTYLLQYRNQALMLQIRFKSTADPRRSAAQKSHAGGQKKAPAL